MLAAALLAGEGENPEPRPAEAPAEAQADLAAVAALAAYLDERICVPRDVGAPVAAAIRSFARSASEGLGGAETVETVSRSVNNF